MFCGFVFLEHRGHVLIRFFPLLQRMWLPSQQTALAEREAEGEEGCEFYCGQHNRHILLLWHGLGRCKQVECLFTFCSRICVVCYYPETSWMPLSFFQSNLCSLLLCFGHFEYLRIIREFFEQDTILMRLE